MKRVPVVGRLGTFTWRMLATVLAGQSIVLFFGALLARGYAIADGREGGATLAVGSALAAAAIVAAGLMRTPLGLPLGWLVQLATFASAVVVPSMIAVGLIFGGLWLWCLVKGTRIDEGRAVSADSEGPAAPAR